MARRIETRFVSLALSWALVGGLALLIIWTLRFGSILWAGFSLTSLVVVLVPSFLRREPGSIPHWGVIGLVTVPLLLRPLGEFRAAYVYVVIAALGLLVAVEIDAFSTAEFTPWFAGAFVAMTTMSVAGLWGIAQYGLDVTSGTEYLAGRTELMWDLVSATVVGLVAGMVFGGVVLRRRSIERRADVGGDGS